jgi:hypothetical protein
MSIIVKFMDCQTNDDVNHVVWENIEVMDENPMLYTFAKKARSRINRLRAERKKSFKDLLN